MKNLKDILQRLAELIVTIFAAQYGASAVQKFLPSEWADWVDAAVEVAALVVAAVLVIFAEALVFARPTVEVNWHIGDRKIVGRNIDVSGGTSVVSIHVYFSCKSLLGLTIRQVLRKFKPQLVVNLSPADSVKFSKEWGRGLKVTLSRITIDPGATWQNGQIRSGKIRLDLKDQKAVGEDRLGVTILDGEDAPWWGRLLVRFLKVQTNLDSMNPIGDE